MDKPLRNTLRLAVTRCRKLLEESIADTLQGKFGVGHDGTVEGIDKLGALTPEEHAHREQLLAHLEHIRAAGFPAGDAVAQLVREVAFTHLNRLAAFKLMEQRKLIREAVSRGLSSNGFKFYLADHPEDASLWSTGRQDVAYRHFLIWQGATLPGVQQGAMRLLFAADDPANALYPPQRVLDQVLDELNGEALKDVWSEDETIGWIYQYFTPKELRDQARKESAAPRNGYELAFRNQFYTPRYVVQFLVENTLGRIWFEMTNGKTSLPATCPYLVHRPLEIFLPASGFDGYTFDYKAHDLIFEDGWRALPDDLPIEQIMQVGLALDGYNPALLHGLSAGDERKPFEIVSTLANARREEHARSGVWQGNSIELWLCLFFEQRRQHHFATEISDEDAEAIRSLYRAWRNTLQRENDETNQAAQLGQPVYVRPRPIKDPRDIKILDPACGSGHFLLYCFELLIAIYLEAWEMRASMPKSQATGHTLRDDYPTVDHLRRAIPELILRHNLHGIDIDLRATQIASLALWLRTQRDYQEQGLKASDRPVVEHMHIACAEPMPGEVAMLDEAMAHELPAIHALTRDVFAQMALAGEAGTLLRIEETLRGPIQEAKERWLREPTPEQLGLPLVFAEPKVKYAQPELDLSGITNERFFDGAEDRVLAALRDYAKHKGNGARYQRGLVARDTERGFDFIDLCRQSYDVVLMNPPFGAASRPSEEYIVDAYPRTKNDLYAAFVERGLNLLRVGGMLGAITSRTGFFLTSFQKWREEILLREARLTVMADLGYGVLDTAMVETAAYCLEKIA